MSCSGNYDNLGVESGSHWSKTKAKANATSQRIGSVEIRLTGNMEVQHPPPQPPKNVVPTFSFTFIIALCEQALLQQTERVINRFHLS